MRLDSSLGLMICFSCRYPRKEVKNPKVGACRRKADRTPPPVDTRLVFGVFALWGRNGGRGKGSMPFQGLAPFSFPFLWAFRNQPGYSSMGGKGGFEVSGSFPFSEDSK